MTYLSELGSYQSKVVATAKRIVDLEGAIAKTNDAAQRGHLQREIDAQRAMFDLYEGMVTFLNCFIEFELRQNILPAPADVKKQAS